MTGAPGSPGATGATGASAREGPASPRHTGAWIAAAATAAFLAVVLLTVNQRLQGAWIERRWLFKSPHGWHWMLAWCAVLGLAALALWTAARARPSRGIPWPAVRWAPAAAVGAWIWSWFAAPPPTEFDLQLALAGAAALWAAGLALWAWRRDAPWPRALRTAEIVLLELALCVLGAELALRGLRALSGNGALATPGTDLDAWIAAHRRAPGSHHLGFPVNSAGLVDVEPGSWPAGTPVVASLGDSFGVAVVPHALHYTTLAEELLGGVQVYNAAVINAGPREYRRLLETDALPLAPRLVVVSLFVGNDLADSTRRELGRVERWIDREEVLIWAVPRRWLARRGPSAAGLGWTDSTFGIDPRRALDAAEALRAMPWLADPLAEPSTLTRERFLYVEHARAGVVQPAPGPDYGALFQQLEALLAAARPTPVALLLIPDEFQVDDDLWRALEKDGVPPVDDRAEPQRRISAWLAERGIPCVDLLPRLRAAEPLADGELHVFHRNDTHFNARGNRIAAEGLAELVRASGALR